jgi:hypothetical protein
LLLVESLTEYNIAPPEVFFRRGDFRCDGCGRGMVVVGLGSFAGVSPSLVLFEVAIFAVKALRKLENHRVE